MRPIHETIRAVMKNRLLDGEKLNEDAITLCELTCDPHTQLTLLHTTLAHDTSDNPAVEHNVMQTLTNYGLAYETFFSLIDDLATATSPEAIAQREAEAARHREAVRRTYGRARDR